MLKFVRSEQINGYCIGLIRLKVSQLIGQAGFRPQDREDLEQEILLRVLQSLPRFNPDLGHINQFYTTVIERYIANILRNKKAKKRDHRRVCSLNVTIEIEDEESAELASTISDRELDARLGRTRLSDQQIAELRLDEEAVLATLTGSCRQLLESRKSKTVASIARELGIHPSTARRRLRALRGQFKDLETFE